MEMWMAAAALCVMAAPWKFWPGARRPNPSCVVLIGSLVGASLYFFECPVLCEGVAFCFCLVLFLVRARREELVPFQNRAVLVTGCDSGFGHALAERLSDIGLKVFAGVLDVHGPGAERLRRRAPENLHVLQLDVTDSSQVQTVFRYISAQVTHTGLWALVNNAGIMHCPMDAELQQLTTLRHFMDVNFLSTVQMSQLFLPLLRRSRGRIVNVSSMAGEVPMPLLAAYGASKAALSLFSRVMRLELAAWGVKVVLIQPAGFKTNIFGVPDDIHRYREELLSSVSSEAREDYGDEYISSIPCCLSVMSQHSAEDLSPVVEDLCHAVLSVHPRPLYTPGRMGWLLPFLHRCCPTSIFDTIITHLPACRLHQPAGLRRR